ELDRGHSPQTSLLTLAVILPLQPSNNGQTKLLAGGPPAAVQHILLQQTEKRLHGCIVAGCPDPAHRTDQPVTFQRLSEFLRTELAAAVTVDCDSARVATVRHSHFHGVDGQGAFILESIEYP